MNSILKNNRPIYFCLFLSGMCALIYQMLWQRFLGILVGVEARSTAMVVAVFLIGLAFGNLFWGEIAHKISIRKKLLKLYALIEFGIGLWAMGFAYGLNSILNMSSAQDWGIFGDFLLTFFLIFAPTFLMGATIPIFTAVLPDDSNEVSPVQTKIYGVNSLGAVLGVLLGPLWAIPLFGLKGASLFLGMINILLGLVFYFCSHHYEGNAAKAKPIPKVEHNFSTVDLHILVFLSGAVALSLEILWIRIWGLSIGPSLAVLPMVLAPFIFGLAAGSLSLGSLGQKKLLHSFYGALFFMMVSFFAAPYLPLWFFHLRIFFQNSSNKLELFFVTGLLLLSCFLVPVTFFLGRLLPQAFALLDKDEKKFPYQCGLIYFWNTLGTFVGSLLLSYLALQWFNIDVIFKINIALIGLLASVFFWRAHRKNTSACLLAGLLLFCYFGRWNRTLHEYSLFKKTNRDNEIFKNLFSLPQEKDRNYKNLMLKDDPNTTVAINQFSWDESRSLVTTGKSDGNSHGDFATAALVSLLPFWMHEKPHELKTAVIGLGTGTTAGILGLSADVASVDVAEIAPAVLEGLPLFSKFNFAADKNPKIKIQLMDGFKFLWRHQGVYDILVSEPSNPWVVGVEQLYTPEFYSRVKEAMAEGGIFVQWMHLYNLKPETLYHIIQALTDKFKNVELYSISTSFDFAFVASDAPFSWHPINLDRRFFAQEMSAVMKHLDFPFPLSFHLTRIMGREALDYLAKKQIMPRHTLEHPMVGLMAMRDFYENENIDVNSLIPVEKRRMLHDRPSISSEITPDIRAWMKADPNYCHNLSLDAHITLSSFCGLGHQILQRFRQMEQIDEDASDSDQLMIYSLLRDYSMLEKKPELLESLSRKILAMGRQWKDSMPSVRKLLKEWVMENESTKVEEFILQLERKKLAGEYQIQMLKMSIIEYQKEFIKYNE